MGHGRTDGQPGGVGRDPAEVGDALEVDEVVEVHEPRLHQEQQLGTTAVERGFGSLGEQRRCLLDGRGSVQLEGAQHGISPR
jgi:hypothetical protein